MIFGHFIEIPNFNDCKEPKIGCFKPSLSTQNFAIGPHFTRVYILYTMYYILYTIYYVIQLSVFVWSDFCVFLDAPMHLYKRVCLSVGRSVRHAFVNTAKNGRIHRESWLSPREDHKSRFRINQCIMYSVNHSLKSFIYEPGGIVGLCWPC